MATTTPNFGWDIPQSTDLVKDGATAIAALGTDIDSALVDLKGGTTGQVLSKNSNTDLDFTWVAQDDTNAIQNTIVDAKGDLITATAADVPARLASSGVNGDVLTIDTSTSTGLKWAAPGGAAKTWTLLNSGGTDLTAAGTITVSGITKDNLLILVNDASSVTAFTEMWMRFNSDSSSKYSQTGNRLSWYTTITADMMQSLNDDPDSVTEIMFGYAANSATALRAAAVMVSGAKSSGIKVYSGNSGSNEGANATGAQMRNFMGVFSGSAITSVSVILGSGNFDNGKIYVYEAD